MENTQTKFEIGDTVVAGGWRTGKIVDLGQWPDTYVVEYKAIFADFGPAYAQLSRTTYSQQDLAKN